MENQIRAGLKVGSKENPIIEKPEALIIYETCEDLGIPRVAGGYEDQPYIWLLEWSIVKNRSILQKNLIANSIKQIQEPVTVKL